jgi:hypothetical protein
MVKRVGHEIQDSQCTYKRNIGERSYNHFYCGKAIYVAYFECVFVALVTQHAEHMCCITLLSLAYLAVTYFSPFIP